MACVEASEVEASCVEVEGCLFGWDREMGQRMNVDDIMVQNGDLVGMNDSIRLISLMIVLARVSPLAFSTSSLPLLLPPPPTAARGRRG